MMIAKQLHEYVVAKTAGNLEEMYPSASDRNISYEQPTPDENTNMNTPDKPTEGVSGVSAVPGSKWIFTKNRQ